MHWAAQLRHREWGEAVMMCPREFLVPPRELIELDPRLSDADGEELVGCRSGVHLTHESDRRYVLRDRKLALRFVDAILGEDGIAAADSSSGLFHCASSSTMQLTGDPSSLASAARSGDAQRMGTQAAIESANASSMDRLRGLSHIVPHKAHSVVLLDRLGRFTGSASTGN